MHENDALLGDVFLGFVKAHILHHAAEEPVHGLALIEELGRHGCKRSLGTLCPLLHGLAEAGYVVAESRLTGGKVHKDDTTTAGGGSALDAVRPKIRDLVVEVLAGEAPA